MVEDGLIERFTISEVYGMHNSPGLLVGAFAIRPARSMPATDLFTITIVGVGGHAAKPHVTIDPTVIACHLVLALQTIVSRNTDPMHSIVVSVTSFRTASGGLQRDPRARGAPRHGADLRQALARAKERLKAIATQTAETFGGKGDRRLEEGRSFDGQLSRSNTEFAAEVARRVSVKRRA